MPHSIQPLLTPFQAGALALPNRVVLAPMTRNRAGAGNVPGDLAVEYYAQRASGGLLVTEGTQITPEGQGYPHTPGIHSDAQVAGWRRVTEAVHAQGGRIVAQLWHVGRISHSALIGVQPVAPSAIRPAGQVYTGAEPRPFEMPRALESSEIPGIVAAYAAAARRARTAGFDGVEIHAANGYLIDQFLRDGTNLRSDRYGGGPENRVRFLLEVTEAVAQAWSPDRVGVRLSPVNPYNDMVDSDPVATFTEAARRLDRLRLAYLHITEQGLEGRPHVTPHLRRVFHGPLMINGGYTRETGNAAIAGRAADLVSFGKPFLANPDLVERFAEHAPLNTPNPATFYGGGAEGYTDYPARAAVAA